MQSNLKILIVFGLSFASLGFLAPGTHADSIEWAAAADGFFSDTNNWIGQVVPGTNDIARFGQAGAYTVTFTGDAETDNLNVYSGNPVFNLGGYTYRVLSTLPHVSLNSPASLTVTNGIFETTSLRVGESAGSAGLLTFGAGAIWNSSGRLDVSRDNGTGTVVLRDGAQAVMDGTFYVGGRNNVLGTFLMTGAGTVMTNYDASFVGDLGEAYMLVADDAHWDVQARLYIGVRGGARPSTLEVSNATVRATGEVWLSHDQNVASHGILRVVEGGRFVQSHTGSGLNDSLQIARSANCSAEVIVESQGYFEANRLMVGYNGEGALEVRGAGSETFSRGILYVGYNNHGSLLIETGGLVRTSGSAEIARAGSWTSVVRVAGAQAEFHANNLYLGGVAASAGGTALTTVAAGGALTVTNTLRLWETSELSIDGGSIAATTVDLKPDAVLKVTLHTGGTNALIVASGTATLTDAVFQLALAPGFSSHYGEVFTIVAGDTSGQFAGIDENTLLPIGGHLFEASYAESFTLTYIPEPGTLALFMLMGAGFTLRRRIRT